MELPKLLLGAILIGITAGAVSCSKGETQLVQPVAEQQKSDALNGGHGKQPLTPENCLACGMG